MNTRNYAQRSNYMCGSHALQLLPFYVQSANIPGINFSLPEVGGRSGYKINLAADNVTFNSLSLEILLDEDYKIYEEITNIVFDNINLELGTYKDFNFDFWLQVVDDMGNFVMKVEYYNCRLESIGDLTFESTDDSTESVFSVDIKYDYHKIIFKELDAPTLII